jgi:hypothetical protein
MTLKIHGENQPRKYVHIFMMQSVTTERIDELIQDLQKLYDNKLLSKQENVAQQSNPVTTKNEKTNIHRVGHVPLDNRGFSGN